MSPNLRARSSGCKTTFYSNSRWAAPTARSAVSLVRLDLRSAGNAINTVSCLLQTLSSLYFSSLCLFKEAMMGRPLKSCFISSELYKLSTEISQKDYRLHVNHRVHWGLKLKGHIV